jgi:hypothetical protein
MGTAAAIAVALASIYFLITGVQPRAPQPPKPKEPDTQHQDGRK